MGLNIRTGLVLRLWENFYFCLNLNEIALSPCCCNFWVPIRPFWIRTIAYEFHFYGCSRKAINWFELALLLSRLIEDAVDRLTSSMNWNCGFIHWKLPHIVKSCSFLKRITFLNLNLPLTDGHWLYVFAKKTKLMQDIYVFSFSKNWTLHKVCAKANVG